MYARSVRLLAPLAISASLKAARVVITLVKSSFCMAKLVERSVQSILLLPSLTWNVWAVRSDVHCVMTEIIPFALNAQMDCQC